MHKIKVVCLLFLTLACFACSDKKTNENAIPEGAFPIVYRGHLYIKGSADSIWGNYVFDTGASNLYYDSTYYAGGNFDYSRIWNAKLPGAGKEPQDVIVIADTVSFLFGDNLYLTRNVPVLHLKPILVILPMAYLGWNTSITRCLK